MWHVESQVVNVTKLTWHIESQLVNVTKLTWHVESQIGLTSRVRCVSGISGQLGIVGQYLTTSFFHSIIHSQCVYMLIIVQSTSYQLCRLCLVLSSWTMWLVVFCIVMLEQCALIGWEWPWTLNCCDVMQCLYSIGQCLQIATMILHFWVFVCYIMYMWYVT